MKTLKFLFAIFVLAFMFGGCTYNFIVPEEVPVIDPEDPNAEQVSFANDIIPIFASICTGCHKTGGQSPDLSAANAYSSISNTRYLNLSNATESLIYTKPSPAATGSHPKYTDVQAALVLGWIQQGAKNN